jgi:hypothetical protein
MRDDRGYDLIEHGSIWVLELNKFAAAQVETERERWLKFFNLDPAVERPLECVPRGVRQGATRRRSGSTPTRCNAVGRCAGRAPGVVAAITRRVSPRMNAIVKAVKALREARSGQLPGSRFVKPSASMRPRCPTGCTPPR